MNTIKLLGNVKKKTLVILVDSGSTHRFLDPNILSQLRRQPEKAKPLIVTVANGQKVTCDTVCKKFQWEVQKEKFEREFRLMKLGACDMLHGMDWIDQYALIQLHTRLTGLSFIKDGKNVWLKRLSKESKLKEASKKEVSRWVQQGVTGFLVYGKTRVIATDEMMLQLQQMRQIVIFLD